MRKRLKQKGKYRVVFALMLEINTATYATVCL